MRRLALLVVLASTLASGIALAQTQSHEAAGARPACVQARGEARMQAYGWDHIVSITNGCAAAITCRVTTSVNPTPVTVRLAPAQSTDTLMWRGSPASAFLANVDCDTAR
ncbi:MAG: hypothetical protein M3Y87_16550 [Myxococcota bacterium]|nr:hypothetical protein [Myxococcota bacterium]